MSVRHASEEGISQLDLRPIKQDSPDAPTITSVAGGGGKAYVYLSAAATGGTPTSFNAVSSPGSFTGSSATSPVAVRGLTSGSSYTFTSSASAGGVTGASSASSSSVTATAPNYLFGWNNLSTTKFCIDSSNNIITASSSGGYAYVQKFSSTGTVSWQNSYVPSSGTITDVYDITVDSFGNIYVCGSTNAVTAGQSQSWMIKLNSSGVLQFVRYNSSGYYYGYGRGLAVDTSDNVYLTGLSNTVNAYVPSVQKYNSSGTLQSTGWWSYSSDNQNQTTYTFTNASGSTLHSGWAYTGGVFSVMLARITSGGTTPNLLKRSTDGQTSGGAVVEDSAGNIYWNYIPSNVETSAVSYFTKFNSSGTRQWTRKISVSSNNGAYAAVVDSSDNIYLNIYANSATYILKYNSSGTLQWQRKLTISNSNNGDLYTANELKLKGTSFYICGTETGVIQCPTDGSNYPSVYTSTSAINGITFTYNYDITTEVTDSSVVPTIADVSNNGRTGTWTAATTPTITTATTSSTLTALAGF